MKNLKTFMVYLGGFAVVLILSIYASLAQTTEINEEGVSQEVAPFACCTAGSRVNKNKAGVDIY